MNSLRNKIQLIGHMGMKPEVKSTEGGKKRASFRVATNEIYKNASGMQVKETQWHNVVAWGKLADLAEKYLDKGREIALEGKLITRQYNDKAGIKKYYTEIQASDIVLLGSKPVQE